MPVTSSEQCWHLAFSNQRCPSPRAEIPAVWRSSSATGSSTLPAACPSAHDQPGTHTITGTHPGTPAPPQELELPRSRQGHAQNVAWGCRVRWSTAQQKWCGRPNHQWRFTVGLLTEAREVEGKKRSHFKPHDGLKKFSGHHKLKDGIQAFTDSLFQVLDFKLTKVIICRNLQFHLFTSFWLWAEKKKGINKDEELQKIKYLMAINNCSHYLQVNSTLLELWQVQCHSLCRSEEHNTRLSHIMFRPSSQNNNKKILAQACPKLQSAHTHQDWKRSESTVELALIAQW